MSSPAKEGISTMDHQEFLESCQESGNQAYANFKTILKSLENPDTRAAARRLLAELEEKTSSMDAEEAMRKYNFRIHQLSLSEFDGCAKTRMGGEKARQTLTLLEMSSIFIPEAWSFTFYEGLTRHPDTGFYDRDISELGCGNGWISIALAERWAPRKVYGVDINPRAIKIAWINLYLNALGKDGAPVVDRDGKTLLDRVEFHVSDLLQYIRERRIQLDRVVGCIPQVLTPDPKAALQIVSETMSEEFLYSLSNYCSLQGFVEDQFGLGLIARAVEESIEVVKPNGAIIFNMGGRPGQAVCERLFERRGYRIKKLWQTRVNQAADTDIMALVEIERDSRHRFEFFMGTVSDEPVSARTAYTYAKAGGVIAHALSVYECRLRAPSHVKAIFKFLQQEGYEETRSALDLSFNNDALADEKIAFLAQLAQTLQEPAADQADAAPETAVGSADFRSQIADFFRLYFRIPISEENVVILPSRAAAIESLMRLYSPSLALVDADLSKAVPKAWLSSLPGDSNPVVLQAPQRSDLLLKLIATLSSSGGNTTPRLVIASLADFEMQTATAFQQLLDATADIGARLFLDISNYLDLSSTPSTNGVLQFLAEQPLPSHAAIICGLVKNQVYSDLEVCFIVSESRSFLEALAKSGELTYFRTAAIKQLFYKCIFHELLSFQIPERHNVALRPPKASDSESEKKFVQVNPNAAAALSHPALEAVQRRSGAESVSDNGASPTGTVRMDLAVNSLPSPVAVKRFLYEAFVRQHVSEAEMDPQAELRKLASEWFILDQSRASIVTADGSATIFASLASAAAAAGATLVFPTGSYANFVATAKFYGAKTVFLPTKAADNFKIQPEVLSHELQNAPNSWLVLSAPVANPTGAVYSAQELTAIIVACQKCSAKIIIDTCFAGIRFSSEPSGKVDLTPFTTIASSSSSPSSSPFSVTILGELSPQFSMASILFGFAIVTDPSILEALSNVVAPHGTLRYAVKKVIGYFNKESASTANELAKNTNALQARAKQLQQVLLETGWEPLEPEGGLFLVARPKAYEGKSLTLGGKTITLSGENIGMALATTTGLHINSSSWTGIPGYCRFVFSIEESDFVKALDDLKKFHKVPL